jgi:hypothetical protein
MVRDQEVSHLVPFVPVGWGRRLQRIEGKSLILVLVVSIPTAPTKSPVEPVGLIRQDSLISWRREVLRPSCAQLWDEPL